MIWATGCRASWLASSQSANSFLIAVIASAAFVGALFPILPVHRHVKGAVLTKFQEFCGQLLARLIKCVRTQKNTFVFIALLVSSWPSCPSPASDYRLSRIISKNRTKCAASCPLVSQKEMDMSAPVDSLVVVDQEEVVGPPLDHPADAEVDLEVLKLVPKRFEVCDEGSANWLVRRIISSRHYEERVKAWAEQERRRAQREETVLLFLFGRQLERWSKSAIESLGGRRKS